MTKDGLALIAFIGVLCGLSLALAARLIEDCLTMADLLERSEYEKAAMRYHIAALSDVEVKRDEAGA